MDESIVYTGLNLVAQDVEATVAFYRLLGITIPEAALWRTDSGVHHVADVEVGGSGVLEFDSPALGVRLQLRLRRSAVSGSSCDRLPSGVARGGRRAALEGGGGRSPRAVSSPTTRSGARDTRSSPTLMGATWG